MTTGTTTEQFPDDADVLALLGTASARYTDPASGLAMPYPREYDYELAFAKLVYKLLCQVGAIGLQVYKVSATTIGVRPGRCLVNGVLTTFAGSYPHSLTNNDVNYVYLDSAGAVGVVTDGTGWPAATHIKLAQITVAAGDFDPLTDLVDLRGYGMLTDLAALTVTVAELNMLSGLSVNVTASNLNTLTAGAASLADVLHSHIAIFEYGEPAHTVGPIDHVAGKMLDHDTSGMGAPPSTMLRRATNGTFAHLVRHDSTGIADSIDNGTKYTQRRVAPAVVTFRYVGEITASQTPVDLGMVDVDGTVEDVILSVAQNGSDGSNPLSITATAKVNGTALCSADPAIDKTAASDAFATTAAAGSGITQATVKSDGTEDVSKGDILSVDLTLTRTASPTTEITDVVVIVVIRPTAAE